LRGKKTLHNHKIKEVKKRGGGGVGKAKTTFTLVTIITMKKIYEKIFNLILI
jgi:hypothetical protein